RFSSLSHSSNGRSMSRRTSGVRVAVPLTRWRASTMSSLVGASSRRIAHTPEVHHYPGAAFLRACIDELRCSEIFHGEAKGFKHRDVARRAIPSLRTRYELAN